MPSGIHTATLLVLDLLGAPTQFLNLVHEIQTRGLSLLLCTLPSLLQLISTAQANELSIPGFMSLLPWVCLQPTYFSVVQCTVLTRKSDFIETPWEEASLLLFMMAGEKHLAIQFNHQNLSPYASARK